MKGTTTKTDEKNPCTVLVPQTPDKQESKKPPKSTTPDTKPTEILDPVKLSNQLEKATAFIRKEVETVQKNVVKSSCRIGHKLWEVRENKLYLGGVGAFAQDFKNVYEYAEKAFGLKKSSTANYIGICEKFSLPGKDGSPRRARG